MASKAEAKRRKRAARDQARAEGILPRAKRGGRREWDDNPRETVARARCRRLGMDPESAENRRLVLSADYGHPLGVLFRDGRISEAEMDAGQKFAQQHHAHAVIMGIPPRTPKGASFGAARGAGVEADPESVRAIRAAYDAAETALNAAGPAARLEVEAMAVEERDRAPSMAALRTGLRALVAHYGMGLREEKVRIL